MESVSVFELIKQVLSSWQVIAVTIALILYLKIVFYAARSYHRPRVLKKINFRRKKSKPEAAVLDESLPDSNPNDELGLEEA